MITKILGLVVQMAAMLSLAVAANPIDLVRTYPGTRECFTARDSKEGN
jgi:hypothetical protein